MLGHAAAANEKNTMLFYNHHGKPALIVPLTGGTTPMFLFTSQGVPVINPGVGWGSRNRAHSPNEFMRPKDFENAARHIARLLIPFAGD